MSQFLREPLVHFLGIGLLLFVIYGALNDADEGADNVIVVNEDRLAIFVQFRTRSFPEGGAAAMLQSLSDEQRERLIEDYVREEAFHREALALGLDKNDYIIKRRLIQSAEYVALGDEPPFEPTEEAVATYYESNRENYRVPTLMTFTHVFLRTDDTTDTASQAQAMLQQLKDNAVQFNQAGQYGDRFPYFLNYVERDESFVAGHFGHEFAGALFALPEASEWVGPLQSAYGYHLVLVANREESLIPALDDVRESVVADLVQLERDDWQQQQLNDIVSKYEVRREL